MWSRLTCLSGSKLLIHGTENHFGAWKGPRCALEGTILNFSVPFTVNVFILERSEAKLF